MDGMPEQKIKAVFTDVGGVMLTNGWDTEGRKLAAARFHLDLEDMDARHHLTFDTYEVGKLLGTRTVLNELIAFSDLGALKLQDALMNRSFVIASFALCGFANISGTS